MSATFARIRRGPVPPVLADVAVGLAETGVALVLGHVGPPTQWPALGLRGTLLTCVINLSVVLRRRFPIGVLLFCLGLWVCYVQLGYWPVVNSIARQLSLSNGALQRTAEQLRHEQQERAREAVMLERTRIARELHDVVAHHLAVISGQAGLAQCVVDTDPATAARGRRGRRGRRASRSGCPGR